MLVTHNLSVAIKRHEQGVRYEIDEILADSF